VLSACEGQKGGGCKERVGRHGTFGEGGGDSLQGESVGRVRTLGRLEDVMNLSLGLPYFVMIVA
jgi:hypothetical protein